MNLCILQVKHGNCGPVKSIKLQRQVNAKTPVSYRLEKVDNGKVSVGYIRLKEFNALARKDLVIGKLFHVVYIKIIHFLCYPFVYMCLWYPFFHYVQQ